VTFARRSVVLHGRRARGKRTRARHGLTVEWNADPMPLCA
jgi:hypothetical protein